jgi:myo-inositol-1(or 4)-monophosphatase
MDDLELLQTALRDAGKIALGIYHSKPKRWQKPDGTFVTEGDLAVDAFLKATICAARPDDGWLSEESQDTAERLTKSRLWIVDPIDGTRAFSEAINYWGIGVALAIDGRPSMGGIYCPLEDVMYHAVRGGGAFRNGERLATPTQPQAAIVPKRIAAEVEALGLPTIGGSSLPLLLRFAAVGTGQHSASISIGSKSDWDIAAGHLMVTETGGEITNQRGQEIIYNKAIPAQLGVVAAQAKWHKALIQITRDQ